MSSSLYVLPPEILVDIFLHLPLQGMLRSRQVSQLFKDIIDHDVRAQYKIELAIAGMEDGPASSLSPADRLTMLRVRQAAWNKLQWMDKFEVPMSGGSLWELYGGVLAQTDSAGDLTFRQLPSAIRGIEHKQWSLPDLGVRMRDFGMDPAQDLLIVIEETQQLTEIPPTCRIHLKSLLTGARHPAAQSQHGILSYTKEPGAYTYIVQTSDDHLGLIASSMQDHFSELLLWNWKTGSLRLRIEGPELPAFAFLSSRYLLLAILPFPEQDEEGHVTTGRPHMVVVDLDTYPPPEDNESVMASDIDYLCAFYYPATIDTFTAVSMTLRSDPGPSWRPNPSLRVPFHISRENRLFAVTIWFVTTRANHHQHFPLLYLFPASTLLDAVAAIPDGAVKHRFEWADWGLKGSRMLLAPPMQSSTWVCYVYGMVLVMALRQNSLKKIVTLDFNPYAVHSRDGEEEHGDGTREGEELMTSAAETLLQGIFVDDVHTRLPYRLRRTFPFGVAGAEGEGDFDAAMVSEDSLLMVSSQPHIRRFRILTF